MGQVSLILAIIAGCSTVGGGIVALLVKIGTFDTKYMLKKECGDTMKESESTRSTCEDRCTHAIKNLTATVGLGKESAALMLEKHNDTNNHTFEMLREQIRSLGDRIFEKFDELRKENQQFREETIRNLTKGV